MSCNGDDKHVVKDSYLDLNRRGRRWMGQKNRGQHMPDTSLGDNSVSLNTTLISVVRMPVFKGGIIGVLTMAWLDTRTRNLIISAQAENTPPPPQKKQKKNII